MICGINCGFILEYFSRCLFSMFYRDRLFYDLGDCIFLDLYRKRAPELNASVSPFSTLLATCVQTISDIDLLLHFGRP